MVSGRTGICGVSHGERQREREGDRRVSGGGEGGGGGKKREDTARLCGSARFMCVTSHKKTDLVDAHTKVRTGRQ